MNNIVQYSLYPNCNNCHKVNDKLVGCAFCLRLNRDIWDKPTILKSIEEIRNNIRTIDWENKFNRGISLMGGEMYYMTDKEIKSNIMQLIDDIINIILIPYKTTRYSTVSNGMYDPNNLLFPIIDKIVEAVGTKRLDINFSYDIKYRFKDEATRQMTLNTINQFHKRYNYQCGVQTILTQYLIDDIMSGKFNIEEFEEKEIPGSNLTFLYPHPINPLLPPLPDFNFTRKSFLNFIVYFKERYPKKYDSFYLSVENSARLKYTGTRDKFAKGNEKPVLSDGKEIINNKCGHSVLYQCYSDCKDCMLCDLYRIGR